MINGHTVSLCMVIHDSSELCAKAISSVKEIVDEIIIVDQGSNDKDAVALKGMCDVYHRTTCKGNADYDRMFCYSLATKEFLLAMDADEVIPPETIAEIVKLFKYDFDIMWFLFTNYIYFNDKKIDIIDMLGHDPHPRFWKRLAMIDGQPQTPIIWSFEAHMMPQLRSEKQVFNDSKFIHSRSLVNVIKTHLNRGKNINPQAQQQERGFIKGVLDKFGVDIKKEMIALFPELQTYLRG